MGSDAVANYDNVSDFEAGNRMVQQALDTFGRLDIVVNNAGILRDKMIFNMTEEEWDIVLAVHLKGHFNLSKHAAVDLPPAAQRRLREHGVGVRPGQPRPGQLRRREGRHHRPLAHARARHGRLRRPLATPSARAPARASSSATRCARRRRRGGAAGMAGFQALEAFGKANTPDAIGPFVAWLCTDAAANVNGRDFMVSGPLIGLYSLPEIGNKITAEAGHIWTIDELDSKMSDGHRRPARTCGRRRKTNRLPEDKG